MNMLIHNGDAMSSFLYIKHDIISANLIDGQMEIVKRFPSNSCYCNGNPCPDTIVKEIYGVVDGKIELIKTIQGIHTPSHVIKETFEFSND